MNAKQALEKFRKHRAKKKRPIEAKPKTPVPNFHGNDAQDLGLFLIEQDKKIWIFNNGNWKVTGDKGCRFELEAVDTEQVRGWYLKHLGVVPPHDARRIARIAEGLRPRETLYSWGNFDLEEIKVRVVRAAMWSCVDRLTLEEARTLKRVLVMSKKLLKRPALRAELEALENVGPTASKAVRVLTALAPRRKVASVPVPVTVEEPPKIKKTLKKKRKLRLKLSRLAA